MTQAHELVLPAGGAEDLGHGSVYFVGTATTIIRYAGFTILTDPNFLHRGEKVHLGYGLTSTRRTDPAMEIGDLPPLDLVLLSHMHEDHFDRVAERDLDKQAPIVTTPHAAKSLKKSGFAAPIPIKTWDSLTVKKGDMTLKITSMPGTHGPGIMGKVLPPVMGSLLQFRTSSGKLPLQLYISGDTLIHDQLREIPRVFPDIDLALLHLGGTRVLGIMVTMDARQGVEAIRIINPKVAVPIHYNDYTVFKSPLDDFKREVQSAGLEDRVRYVSHGDTYAFEIPESRLT
ncbi:MAG: MBL fold metallo-hydrolase [Chloroflexia bacterium]|nr:MBL fold metallo-hydrolase [Chloroflexia bacterium]